MSGLGVWLELLAKEETVDTCFGIAIEWTSFSESS